MKAKHKAVFFFAKTRYLSEPRRNYFLDMRDEVGDINDTDGILKITSSSLK
jgi:hypothetical protein